MLITVTDKGLPAHEYAKSCKCRGCIAVSKAKMRAIWLAIPVGMLSVFFIGFFFGKQLGSFTGLAAGAIGLAIWIRLSPSSEVLKDE